MNRAGRRVSGAVDHGDLSRAGALARAADGQAAELAAVLAGPVSGDERALAAGGSCRDVAVLFER